MGKFSELKFVINNSIYVIHDLLKNSTRSDVFLLLCLFCALLLCVLCDDVDPSLCLLLRRCTSSQTA